MSLMKREPSALVELVIVAVVVLLVGTAPSVSFLCTRQLAPDERLLTAAWIGDHGEFEAALAQGASVQARDTAGTTPLHYAASCGDAKLVSRLIALGGDVNARNEGGATPLMNSAVNDRAVAAETLLRCGAEPTDRVLEAAARADAGQTLRVLQLWRNRTAERQR